MDVPFGNFVHTAPLLKGEIFKTLNFGCVRRFQAERAKYSSHIVKTTASIPTKFWWRTAVILKSK